MGQKVHPTGLRIGQYRKWKSNWFLKDDTYGNFLHLNLEINKYFAGILRNTPRKSFFSHCIIAKYSLEKLYIFVFFYRLRPEKIKRVVRRQKYNQRPFFSYPNINAKLQNDFLLKKNLNLLENDNKNFINDGNISVKNFIDTQPLVARAIDLNSVKFNLSKVTYKSPKLIKNSLSNFVGSKVKVTFINLLSFVNFYLNQINQENSINSIQRQLTNFYKYDVKLLGDAINIFFISIILKQPQTLAKFIGYQLRKTPKNRRHGKLVRLYANLMRLAFAQHTELIGLQIQFKGRINGRKRKRQLNIKLGELPLQSYEKSIEYGQANAITIYGTIGVKVWIYYDNSFNNLLQQYFLKYFSQKYR